MKNRWWGFYTQLPEGECCKPGASTKCGPATYFGTWTFVQNKIIKGHNVSKCKYKSFTTEKQADDFMRYGPEGKQNATKSTESITNDTTKVFIDWSLKPEETDTANPMKRKAPEKTYTEGGKTFDWKTQKYITRPEVVVTDKVKMKEAPKKNCEVIEKVKPENTVPHQPEVEILKQKIASMKINQVRLEDENQKLTKTIQKLKNSEPKKTVKIIEPRLIVQEEGRSPPATDEETEHDKQTTISRLVCYAYAFNATNQNGGFGLFFPDHKTFTTSQPVDRLKLQCDDMTQLKWKGEFSTLEAIHQALMLAKRVGAKSVLLKLRNDMSEKHLTKLWLSEVWKGEDWQRKFETSLSNKILGLMGVIATEFEVVEAEKEVDLLDIADQLAVVGSAMSFV